MSHQWERLELVLPSNFPVVHRWLPSKCTSCIASALTVCMHCKCCCNIIMTNWHASTGSICACSILWIHRVLTQALHRPCTGLLVFITVKLRDHLKIDWSQKKPKLFSLSLNPLPPQMTKKHRCLASFILFKTLLCHSIKQDLQVDILYHSIFQ
jgi:hypothetical protein